MKNSKELIKFLRDYNKWRRGDDKIEQPHPKELGKVIDDVCELVEKLEKQLHDTRAAEDRNR